MVGSAAQPRWGIPQPEKFWCGAKAPTKIHFSFSSWMDKMFQKRFFSQVAIYEWKMWDVLKRMKNQFSDFHYFSFWDMLVFLLKISQFSINFEYQINHNSKNRKRKIDSSFDSARCAFFMQIWPLLKDNDFFLAFLVGY